MRSRNFSQNSSSWLARGRTGVCGKCVGATRCDKLVDVFGSRWRFLRANRLDRDRLEGRAIGRL
jgi:hypothetical protein